MNLDMFDKIYYTKENGDIFECFAGKPKQLTNICEIDSFIKGIRKYNVLIICITEHQIKELINTIKNVFEFNKILELKRIISDLEDYKKYGIIGTNEYNYAMKVIEDTKILNKDWLKTKRKEKNITQGQLAKAIGVTTSAIAKIEQGQRYGSEEIWDKIREYFNLIE